MLEVLLGVTIFGMFMFAVSMVLMHGQEGSIAGGDRVRGAFMAQRMIEASRSLRDASFVNVTTGDHGIRLSGTTWAYNGTTSTASGGFTMRVTVNVLANDWMELTARSSWKRGISRSGSILLTSELTNWRAPRSVGNWSTLSLSGSYVVANAYFNDAAVLGNYAYVTSETSGGGAGLYVLNLNNLGSPSLATTVNIGGAGYHAAVKGQILYVVGADANAEVKAYDLTNPAAPTLKTSYNLPGSGRAKSLAYADDYLYVVGIPNSISGERSIYQFDISASGAIILLDDLDDDATGYAVALTGTSAYLATSDDLAELKLVLRGTGSISAAGEYNISDASIDALSIAITGTSALLGREKSSYQELVVFDVTAGGIPSSPGPWFHEGSGSLVGLDADGDACFGFLAASSGRKALQVVDLSDRNLLPELTTYTSAYGKGRGLHYDHRRDKVYLLTDNAFLTFQAAGSGTNPCP